MDVRIALALRLQHGHINRLLTMRHVKLMLETGVHMHEYAREVLQKSRKRGKRFIALSKLQPMAHDACTCSSNHDRACEIIAESHDMRRKSSLKFQ